MTAPSTAVRAATYDRDGRRCVSCGATDGLSYQHRAVEGMGGRVAAPFLEEGVTACVPCNEAFEGHLRARALVGGWKVPTWVRDRGLAATVPVFVAWRGQWVELTRDGIAAPISRVTAVRMMREVYGPRWDEMEAAA